MNEKIWKNYELWKENINEEFDIDNTDNPLYCLRFIIEELYCQDNSGDLGCFIEDVDYLISKLNNQELNILKEYNRNILNDFIITDSNGKEIVKVYRGFTKSSVNYNVAMSFTPLKEYAEIFADLRSEDYGEEGFVVSGWIFVDDILWVYQQNNNKKFTELIIKSGTFHKN